MSNAKTLGEAIANACREDRNLEAIDQHYADDIVSIEAMSMEMVPAEMTGKAAIRKKNEWWLGCHEVHDRKVSGPFPNGDQFTLHFELDITPSMGPNKGERMTVQEVGLYTVKDGKIVREVFFYDA